MAEEFGLEDLSCDELMTSFTDATMRGRVLLQVSDTFEQFYDSTSNIRGATIPGRPTVV